MCLAETIVNLFKSFDSELYKFGVDVAALQDPVTTRTFRAWVEDWEKEELLKCDPVIEARFLEKYKNLRFKFVDTGAVFTVAPQNAEFHRKKGDRGWHLICETNGGVGIDDVEAFTIALANKLIGAYPQEEGVEVIRADADAWGSECEDDIYD